MDHWRRHALQHRHSQRRLRGPQSEPAALALNIYRFRSRSGEPSWTLSGNEDAGTSGPARLAGPTKVGPASRAGPGVAMTILALQVRLGSRDIRDYGSAVVGLTHAFQVRSFTSLCFDP